MAIKRSFILSSGIGLSADNLFVVNNTNSVSSTTGSIVLSGGIGIGQSASISGRLQMFNGANYTSFVSSASGNTVYTLPATSPATGSSVLQSTSAGVLSWVPMTATGGGGAGTVYDGSLNSIPYYPTAGTAITGSSSFTNTGTSINIGYTTAATNSSSGALTIVGGVGIGGSLYVAGDLTINGTTTTINSITLTVDDKNIELGSVSSPSDVTAEGGGINLRGASDKSINWYTGTGWSSSESFNLVSGSTYKINNTAVISNSSIGTGITNSSLTALGTITTGVWSGTSITAYYGGTGLQTTFTVGDLLYANTSFTWGRLTANSNSGYVLTSAGSGATPTYVAQSTLSVGNATTSGLATTATYAYQSGYGLTSGFATTSTYSHQSGYGITAGLATTSTYSHQSGYAITSGSSATATTATYAHQSGYAITSGFATTANYSYQSGYGLTSGFATTSTYSHQSGYAITSGSSGTATTATYAHQSGYAITSGSSGLATTANYAHQSGYAITSGSSATATTATYAHQSGYAITSGSSGTANTAQNINVVLAFTNTSHPLLFTPTSGSASGLAVSSNTTLVYNPSTDILSVFGAAITSTTSSTSTTSGALIVTGGVGIGQSVSVGGRLQMFNAANYTAFVSSATGNTVYTLPATSPATGSSVLQSTSAGVMSWVPMTVGSSSGNTSQNIVINTAGNANVFHPVLLTPSPLSAGSAVSSDSTITFNPLTEILNVSGLAVTSGTASTNTTTGALVVRGGLGVTGQLSFAKASFGFTGITTNPTMSFIGATSASPITLTVLTDNSLNFEGSQGSVFSIDSNLSSGEIFSVSDISGLPIISASAGQTVTFNEFGGFTQIGNGSINSSSTTTGSLFVSGGLGITGNANIGGTVRITNTTASISSTSGALTVSGGVGIGLSASIAGRLQLFNGANYTAFVSSATGNTVYTLPATSPAIGTSYLTSTSAGILSWTAPSKANYVLSFGAGFTPTASSADSVSLNIPYTPDGTTKYYYVKRIEYRNETLSGGTGLSFYLERHTSGNASWTITNRITAGSGASFFVGAAVYSSSFTTISSSSGIAASVVSGDYVRLFFTTVESAANVSIAMTIEEQ